MAKKKGINKLYLVGGAGGAVAVVLVAVFVFGIGAGVLPFLPAGAYNIDNFPSIDQATELNNANLGEQAEQVFLETPNCEGATNDDFLNAEPDLPEQCDQQEEVQKIIDMQMPINNSTIPMNNTSQTPPPEQICDIDPQNIICQLINPPTSSVNLLSSVTKIDSLGNEVIVQGSFTIPQLSFFVEDTTNIDYRTGFLRIELKLDTDNPLQNILGTGDFEITVGTNQVITAPISISGTSDVDGSIPVEFLSPTGVVSPSFTFSFDEFFSSFANEQVTRLNANINNLEINIIEPSTLPDAPTDATVFGIFGNDLTVFSMNIARDDEQIIITDEQGITTRLFPTDSNLILTSIPKGVSGVICFIWTQTTLNNAARTTTTSGDRNAPLVEASCISTVARVVVGTAPPPQLSGIIILDQDGQLLLNLPGGGGTGTTSIRVLDELVTRNENYTLKISSPVFDSALSYGKSQETQSYTCQYNPTAIYFAESLCVTPTGCFGGCATTCYIAIKPTKNVWDNNEITCTLP